MYTHTRYRDLDFSLNSDVNLGHCPISTRHCCTVDTSTLRVRIDVACPSVHPDSVLGMLVPV